jgi:CBS domain-containing protein
VDQAGSIGQQRHVGTDATRRLRAWVDALTDPAELSGYQRSLVAVTEALVADGSDALTAARTITAVNDAVTTRLLALAEQRFGPPPQPYAWLVLGSGGRAEQALLSDQDNAIVYERADVAAHSYFGKLADYAVEGLVAAGLPHCPGGYMATCWHHPLAEWERIFHGWVGRPEPQAIVEAEVFLDFRLVHGRIGLEPLDAILRQGAEHPRFLVHMARAAIAFRPPLSIFGRIRGPHHVVDLKRGGLAAIVLLARLYALAGGSVARPTLDRLDAAARAGKLSADGARRLATAYRTLSDVRLRTQLSAAANGHAPSNKVLLEELDAETQHRVREAFRTVRQLQQTTALRFPTDAIT